MTISYKTTRRWCDSFSAGFVHRVKAARRKPDSTWHFDEMFVTLHGEPYLLWRAVDEYGAELDILLQTRHEKAAAKRFFKRLLRCNPVPRKILTDELRSYPAAKVDIPELLSAKHVFVRAAARVNNPTTGRRIPISPHLSASDACEVFVTRGVRRPSCRASVRSGSTSH